jgi:hypothetical protein
MKGDDRKKVRMTLLIAGSYLAACAQGTVLFENIHVGAPNAPVYESDGVTKLSGPQYMAELLAGPSVTSLASVATTSFMTGNGAGYFEAGSVAIDSVPPGTTAWVAVEVWNTESGVSFAEAKASSLPNSWWESSVFSVQTEQFNGIPLPVPLTGLGTSPVYLNGVPEPSTLALAALGAAFLWFRMVRLRPRSGSSYIRRRIEKA